MEPPDGLTTPTISQPSSPKGGVGTAVGKGGNTPKRGGKALPSVSPKKKQQATKPLLLLRRGSSTIVADNQELNLDTMCGVQSPESKTQCHRSLSCKVRAARCCTPYPLCAATGAPVNACRTARTSLDLTSTPHTSPHFPLLPAFTGSTHVHTY